MGQNHVWSTVEPPSIWHSIRLGSWEFGWRLELDVTALCPARVTTAIGGCLCHDGGVLGLQGCLHGWCVSSDQNIIKSWDNQCYSLQVQIYVGINSTSESDAMVPCQKMVDRPPPVLLHQGKEFQYFMVLFTSDRKGEREMDRWFGVASAALQAIVLNHCGERGSQYTSCSLALLVTTHSWWTQLVNWEPLSPLWKACKLRASFTIVVKEALNLQAGFISCG